MFEEGTLAAHSFPQLTSTHGFLQCADKSSEFYQPSLSLEDCFITDLEDYLNSTDIPKERDYLDMIKTTPTPSPTNMEVPDFYYNNSPMQSSEEYNMASPQSYKENGICSPQVVAKEESPLNSPQSLYHDRCMVLSPPKEEPKQKVKYGHLVSLLSAPPMPMTNTINDNIISQLGHATSADNATIRAVGTLNDKVIKKEVVDCGFLKIKQEVIEEEEGGGGFNSQQLGAEMSSAIAGNTVGHLTCDIGSLAMEHVYRDIQATCNSLGICRDPTKWSCADVRSWLMKTVQELKLPAIALDYFQLDGMAICALNELEFCQRAPQCGETLYAQLYIWKTASNYRPTSSVNRYSSSSDQAILDDLASWHSNFGSPGSPDSLGSLENAFVADVRKNPVENCGKNVPSCSSSIKTEGTHTDDDITSEDGECMDLAPTEAIGQTSQKSSTSHIHLWQFLKELLSQPHLHGSCIRWIDRSKGIFKIEDSVRVARLWGKRKNRPAMNYDKLSRSIRQYYKKGIMKKTERSQRLVYQFCPPYCL